MTIAAKWLGTALAWCAGAAVVALGLPLLVLALLLLRGVLLLGAIAAIVGTVVLWCVSRRFRLWLIRATGMTRLRLVTGAAEGRQGRE